MDAMESIKQTFFEECEEQLAELETGLLAMEEGDTDKETVNAVFRAVHSIKGGAGAFQLQDLVHFAHTFETTLDLIRDDKLEASSDVMRVMLRSSDLLSDLVVGARDDVEVDKGTWEPVAKELEGFNGGPSGDGAEEEDDCDFTPMTLSFDDLGGDAEGGEAGPIGIDLDDIGEASPEDDDGNAQYHIEFKPKPALYENANDPCLLLRELTRLGSCMIECDISEIPSLDEIDPAGAYLSWTISVETEEEEEEVTDVFEFVEGDCELKIENKSSPLPDDIDISALIDAAKADVAEVKGEVEAGATAEVPEIADAPVAEVIAATPEPQVEQAAAPEKPEAPEPKAKAEKPAAAPKAQKAAPQQTIRVDLERVDRLINLVGELVINQAMLSQSVLSIDGSGSTDVGAGLDELEQLTREIQDSVMAIRAQPVKPMFQRMSRVVREAADATGKKIRLKSEGDTTEVDKTVIEKLADPLTHMIRNAVDHGVESPDKRVENGKPEEGTIQLLAAHRSGRVVIEVSDDGAGINREKVKEIAIDKGLIAADAQLTDNEIDNLIFAPGFSTASEVSDLSGRGVGMDVVKRSIQALGGRVSITSNPGRGSVFTMSLPLTLAVLDGMVVTVGEQTLVVPMTAIVETLRPTKSDVHQLGSDDHVISIRDNFVPIIDTGRELDFKKEPSVAEDSVVILVESDDDNGTAILVDRIVDQSQVVIKSLETNYGHVEGIAAATILGDGRVALILDVDALVTRSRQDVNQVEQNLALAG